MDENTAGPDRRTLTIIEAGAALGISRTLAYEAAAKGQIPTIRIGRRLLVPKQAFDRLVSGDAA
ncbi:MAG: helix-turn-helix domain-containing protein [Stellaceae bacterium]